MSDERIPILLESIIKIAEGDFDVDIPISDAQDEIEAIAMGVHMLADELKSTIVSKEKAKNNEERYNRLLETISDGVLEVNKNQEVIYSNGNARTLLKLSEEEILRKKTGELFFIKDSKIPINLTRLSDGIHSQLANAIVQGCTLILSLRINILPGKKSTLISFSDITNEYTKAAATRVRNILEHEEDRQKIAHRIHEEVAQVLNAVAFQMSIAEKDSGDRMLSSKLTQSKELLSESIREIRAITKELAPTVLNYGVKESLESLINEISNKKRRTKFSIRCKNLDGIRFDHLFESTVYIIVEYLLMVGVKYGNSSDIALVIELKDQHLFLDYYDIGTGFESLELSEIQEIGNMSDRVSSYHGSVRLDTEFDIGLSVYINFDVSNLLLEKE